MPTTKKPTPKKPIKRVPDPPRVARPTKLGRPHSDDFIYEHIEAPPPVKRGPGNPKGKPPGQAGESRLNYEMPSVLHQRDEIKQLSRLTHESYCKILDFMVRGSRSDLEAINSSGDATVLEAMIGSLAYRVITHGDVQAHDALMNRLIGKVKDKIEHSGDGLMPRIVIQIPSNGREAN